MHPFKIAHISDLHLSAEHHRKHLRYAKRLIAYAQEQEVDHFVITGDIAANAEKKDLELARHLFRAQGLLDPKKLTLVIGNHDIFGGVHVAEDVLSFPKRCRHVDYEEKVELFRHTFREAFDKCVAGHPDRLFPFAKVLGDLLLVGVNSVARYSKLGNPIGSNGEVDDSEFDKLEMMLSSPFFRQKRKIVLIHHHFSKPQTRTDGTMHSVWAAVEQQTMKLRGKKRLLRLFKEHNVELVLHGHLHENGSYVRGGVRLLNGGGSVISNRPGELQLNILSVTDEGITTETHMVPLENGLTGLSKSVPVEPEFDAQAA